MKVIASIIITLILIVVLWRTSLPYLLNQVATALRKIPIKDREWIGQPLSSASTRNEQSTLSSMHIARVDKQKTFSCNPQFHMISNDREFKVFIDIPGVKADDVQVTNEGNILSVRGSRVSKGEEYLFRSSFSQTFNLDSNIIIHMLSASINEKEGVLMISGPKHYLDIGKLQNIPVTAISSNKTVDNHDDSRPITIDNVSISYDSKILEKEKK